MPSQLLIIAIDLVDTPFLEQGRARQQLLKYLSEDLPTQPFALVAITKNGLHQIHSFSSDPAALAAALRRMEVSTTKDEMQGVTLDTLGSDDQNEYATGVSRICRSTVRTLTRLQPTQRLRDWSRSPRLMPECQDASP